MKITIWWTEQERGGYMYNIWLNEDADENEDECDDGGFCQGGTYDDAILMACENARDLLKLEQQGLRTKRVEV